MDLKPCPFCGCELSGYSAKYGRNGWFIFAQCEICGAESKKFGVGRNKNVPDNDDDFWACEHVLKTCDKVAKMWNMRRCSDARQDDEGVHLYQRHPECAF